MWDTVNPLLILDINADARSLPVQELESLDLLAVFVYGERVVVERFVLGWHVIPGSHPAGLNPHAKPLTVGGQSHLASRHPNSV